ncbi:MAG: hypothetical protein KDE48_20000, partial [Anaerolineales bacterium]|nr:hypothetical protein [Anaerolineales bacterium]
MGKKFVVPVFIVCILLITALYQASAQHQPTITKQSIDPSANAGWEEVGIGSAAGGGISNNAGKSAWPSMFIDDYDDVFVSWNDDTTGVDQIYLLRWNGAWWGEYGGASASGGGVSNNVGKSVAPDVTIGPFRDGVCVAWRDWSSGYAETYFDCTFFGNGEWNGGMNGGGISNQQGESLSFPSAVYTGNTHPIPFVAWNESDGNDQEIYLYSIVWGEGSYVTNLSNNSGDSWSPSVIPGTIAWHDHSNNENAAEIYIRRYNGDEIGQNSASDGGISNTPGQSGSPSLVANNYNQLFVAWEDNTNGNYEIYVRHWNGYQWSELGTGSASGGGISNNPGDSLRPRVALDPDGIPYVAWYDNSSGNYEIYARRWNGLTWEEVGYGSATGGGISNNAGASGYLDLAIDSNGIPYVAWDDDSNGNQEIYVRRYSGQSPPTPTNT